MSSLPAWWRVLSEFAYFVALASIIGGSLAYLTVVRPVIGDVDGADRLAVTRRSGRLLAWCGPVLLIGGYLQLAGRVARGVKGVSFWQALGPQRIWSFLTLPAKPGEWISSGTLVLIQNLLFLAVAMVLLAGRRPRLVAAIVLPVTILASLVISVPTNWSTQSADLLLDALLTQAHVVGACAWLGGIAGLAVLAWTGRLRGRSFELFWARCWQRFSLVALVAVGGLIATGSWMAWRHVGSLGQFLTTTYGRFLLVKLLIVAAIVTAGAINQLVLIPRIARTRASGQTEVSLGLVFRRFPIVAAVETVLGLCVLLIVPFLSGSARKQAGDLASPTLDGGLLTLGVLLLLTLAASLYASHRVSRLRCRTA